MSTVTAIAVLHPDRNPVEGRTQKSARKQFAIRDIRNGLAFEWATDYARSLGAPYVIVCTPSGSHKFLSPMTGIPLR